MDVNTDSILLLSFDLISLDSFFLPLRFSSNVVFPHWCHLDRSCRRGDRCCVVAVGNLFPFSLIPHPNRHGLFVPSFTGFYRVYFTQLEVHPSLPVKLK